MADALAILVVEDSQGDFLLLKRHCERQSLAAEWHRVDRSSQMADALQQRNWDLVLFDYSVPGLDFPEALQQIQSRQPDLPVILVSGSIGDEKVIELMKLGLRDFVHKENLNRLLSAIYNTVREAQEARAARAASAQLAREHLRLQTILRTASDGIHILDSQGLLVEANPAFLAMLGYDEQAVGRLKVSDWDAQDSWQVIKSRNDVLLAQHGKQIIETRHRRSDGEIVHVELNISAIEIEGEAFIYASARDITERKLAQDRITEMAYFDHLTGLSNRRMLRNRLIQTLAVCARNSHKAALLFIDLDKFKTVNDMFGHNVGDWLLQEVAQRLKQVFRIDDTVARIGGDEFMVLLSDLGIDPEAASLGAEAAGAKVVSALQQLFNHNGTEIESSCSVGITLFGDQATSIDEIMKQADTALYQAKLAGRNNFCFFDEELQAALRARSILETELKEGLKKGQFVLLYQPQIDRDDRVIGAEALLRWQHPSRGLVTPDQFIPVAEETGLIISLGRWVLETACQQIAAWGSREETAHLTVAVNVSAQQFRQNNFVENVIAVVLQTGADPARLKLELTETMLVDNIPAVIAKMDELQKFGLCFSLDDFGTGYSSLSYLKLLPMSQLKIDQSFVHDLADSPSDRAIARTIIILAESLGLNVIAEGVEEVEQRSLLASFGCDAYQGYLFSRPLTLSAFEQFLEPDANRLNRSAIKPIG